MTAASSSLPAPHLMPLMRYRDLAEAMSWLERAFGFEKQTAVTDSDGEVIYGQMTYRGSLLMLGAVRETDLDKLMRQPDEVGDVETQSCYIVVDDADEHYARATDAGAEIVLEIKSDGLGRRGYSCRDPQGHIWNFGTYNPAKGVVTASPLEPDDDAASPALDSDPPRRSRAPMVLAALLLALGAGTWWYSDAIKADLAHRLAHEKTVEAEAAYAELAKVRAEKRASDALAAQLQADLATAKAQKTPAPVDTERAERDRAQIEKVQAELAEMRAARLKAEAEARSLRIEIENKQDALDAANEAKRITEEKLAVKSAAEEARLREAARKPPPVAVEPEPQRVQAEAPPTSVTPLKKPRDEGPPVKLLTREDADASPAGSRKLETSATSPAAPAAKPDKPAPVTSERADENKEKKKSAAEAPSQKRAAAKRGKPKRAAAKAPKGPPPTYVINLRSVPWPYDAWYK